MPSSSSDKGFRTALVADDHEILRKSVIDILTGLGGYEIAGEAKDGLEAIAMVRKHRPDLLMLDVAMPLAQGIGVYHEARRWSPGTRIIIFTGMTSGKVLGELVQSGVDGLFLKTGDVSRLAEGIPLVMDGEKVIADEVLELIEETPDTGLTAREKQVLSLIATGHANKDIAEKLGLSFKTVDHHRTNLMRKLDVHSTAELLSYALREGYLDHARET